MYVSRAEFLPKRCPFTRTSHPDPKHRSSPFPSLSRIGPGAIPSFEASAGGGSALVFPQDELFYVAFSRILVRPQIILHLFGTAPYIKMGCCYKELRFKFTIIIHNMSIQSTMWFPYDIFSKKILNRSPVEEPHLLLVVPVLLRPYALYPLPPLLLEYLERRTNEYSITSYLPKRPLWKPHIDSSSVPAKLTYDSVRPFLWVGLAPFGGSMSFEGG